MTLIKVKHQKLKFTQFANCEETMKEKADDEEIRYVVPHVVTSLDEPVTQAEFFV